jgi:hypothetical protein
VARGKEEQGENSGSFHGVSHEGAKQEE